MTRNLLVTEPIDEAGLAAADEFADVTRGWEYPDREALLADADRFDAVLVRTFEVDRDLLERAENLRVVSKHGVGLDNVDVEAASERGVAVTRVVGANSRAVAEHALLLLLALRRRLPRVNADVHAGVWDRGRYETHTLAGDVLGLWGLGDVGREVAALAAGFGLETLAHDPYVDAADAPDGVELVGHDALFERADAVSVHAPLTDETRGAIGAAELAALPDSGVVVNTARGGIVDEAALAAALDAGGLAGAGLDVFANEPPDPDHPLLGREDVIATPHLAGNTAESLRKLAVGAVANVRVVSESELPEETVNADAFDAPD